MKFARILSVGLAAAAALSFTACDDSTSSTPDAKAEINKTTYKMGSQEQTDLPSILSIRKNGTIFIKDLDAVPANVENIDVIMYEDFNTTTSKLDKNNAKLWSPDAFATDAIMKDMGLSKNYILKSTVAKTTKTRFAQIDADLSKIATRGDLDKILAEIPDAAWTATVDVVTDDVIAINASGTKVIARVVSAAAVDHASTASSSDGKAVNLEILVAQKI